MKPPRILSSRHRCFPALLAAAVCAATARAEVVFQDDFEGADEIENVAAIESKGFWEVSGQRNTLSVAGDPEGLNSGKALVLGSGITLVPIPPTTLGAGDSLILSLRFRSLDEKVEFPSPLRIGLCESRDDAPDTGDTAGYWLATGPGAEARSAILLEKNEDSIGGGNDRETLGQDFLLGLDWREPRRIIFKIVRVSEDLIEIHTELDGSGEVVRADPKATVTQLNLLAFRLANTPQSKLPIDDVKVEVERAAK